MARQERQGIRIFGIRVPSVVAIKDISVFGPRADSMTFANNQEAQRPRQNSQPMQQSQAEQPTQSPRS